LLVDSGLNIASFGLDQNGEPLVTAYNGRVYRITQTIPEFTAATGFGLLLIASALIIIVKAKRKNFAGAN
jgi:hypothetical protein